jgi:deoxyhypusine synthase
MYAAAEKTYQLSVQDGKIVLWEIFFASYVIKGDLKVSTIWNRVTFLADWYPKILLTGWIFQIGGGIAGDFPICVVPMLYQDMETPFSQLFLPNFRFNYQLRFILELFRMKKLGVN